MPQSIKRLPHLAQIKFHYKITVCREKCVYVVACNDITYLLLFPDWCVRNKNHLKGNQIPSQSIQYYYSLCSPLREQAMSIAAAVSNMMVK